MTYKEASIFRDKYINVLIGKPLVDGYSNYLGQIDITTLLVAKRERLNEVVLKFINNELSDADRLKYSNDTSEDYDVYAVFIDDTGFTIKQELHSYLDRTNQWLKNPDQ